MLSWMYVEVGGRVSSMWTTKKRIRAPGVILSSSCAKELAFLYQNVIFEWNKKSGNLQTHIDYAIKGAKT